MSIIAPDGLTIADRCRVVRPERGHVWLGKPLRLVELEPVGWYDNGQSRVVPRGTGVSIQHVRDGRKEDGTYQSEEACKAEILRRQPSRAA